MGRERFLPGKKALDEEKNGLEIHVRVSRPEIQGVQDLEVFADGRSPDNKAVGEAFDAFFDLGLYDVAGAGEFDHAEDADDIG